MAKRVAIYVRVSTDGQSTDNQQQELEAMALRGGWEIVRVFVDHGISGAKGREQRPAFDALCKAVARREVDLVAAWAVDRVGRSLRDLVDFFEELRAKGVGLYLHQQGLDTTTPAGRAMFERPRATAARSASFGGDGFRCGREKPRWARIRQMGRLAHRHNHAKPIGASRNRDHHGRIRFPIGEHLKREGLAIALKFLRSGGFEQLPNKPGVHLAGKARFIRPLDLRNDALTFRKRAIDEPLGGEYGRIREAETRRRQRRRPQSGC